MNTLIVCSSRSHGNTRLVADAIGRVLHAPVVHPSEVTPDELAGVERIGFGSGIYWMAFDPLLIDCVRALPNMPGHRGFAFATSGMPQPPFRPYLRKFETLLTGKGFDVDGTFSCRGLDTMGPLRIVGGVNKNRPGTEDLSAASAFAHRIAALT